MNIDTMNKYFDIPFIRYYLRADFTRKFFLSVIISPFIYYHHYANKYNEMEMMGNEHQIER